MYVVDASVAAKWFFHENATEMASQIYDSMEQKRISVVVPDLFFVELASVWHRRVRNGSTGLSQAIRALENIRHLFFERCSDFEFADVAFEHATILKVSIYDAIYLSIAETYCAPLITADEVLIKACNKRFDWIKPLEDFR